MLFLSVSAIKDYLVCPKIYWYRVHKKSTFVPDEYITRGNVVHKAIEVYNNFEDAMKFVKTSYPYSTPPGEIQTMLYNYYTDIEPQLPDKRDVERTFKLVWSDDVYLVGKIDRITPTSIYDWKTAIKPPDAYELQDMQFYIYWWAYRHIFKREPSVFYGHLYSGKLLPIDINEEMWYNIERLVNEIIGRLTDENSFYPRLFGYRCKRCFYKGVCLSDYELGD